MLLNGPVKNDHRVIKMINTLSQKACIDLYYINGSKNDFTIFNENVNLYSYSLLNSITRKILQHTFFTFEFNFFIKKVISKKKNYNFIWANDLPTLYPAYRISKKLKGKLIYDSHEIYLETLNQFFPDKSNIFKSFIFKGLLRFMKFHGLRIEKKIIKKTPHFITVNDSLNDYFNKKYEIKNGISIMNFPNLGTGLIEQIDFRKQYNWNKLSFILIYQGMLNKGRGLELLIDSFTKLPKNYKLIILGNGIIKPQLLKKTVYLKLENQIKFIDKLSIEKLLTYTSGADIGVNLLEDSNLSKRLASPNKLFEYIHAEIPVICSDTIENRKVILKHNIGILTKNNINNISNCIINISLKDLNSYKTSLRLAKKEYKWENQEEKILSILNFFY